MLIKKTIVLTNDSKTIGHLSIIRVGQERGVKLSLVKSLEGTLFIKIGSQKEESFEVKKVREEYSLNSNVESSDLIGVLLVGRDGEVVGRGGNSSIITSTALKKEKELNKVIEEKTDYKEPKEEVQAPIVEETEKEVVVEEVEDIVEEVEEIEEVNVDYEKTKTTPFNFIKGENFYRNVKGKLSEIMTVNPTEKRLEKLIPDSKWVKVYYEKGEYYVVGILSEDGEVKFLSYGVPGVRSVKPPKDAEDLCDFVEVEGSLGEGYWLMFQDAKTGEIVKSID